LRHFVAAFRLFVVSLRRGVSSLRRGVTFSRQKWTRDQMLHCLLTVYL
jgi:hypothetical protein